MRAKIFGVVSLNVMTEIHKKLEEVLPPACEMTKAEFEGPDLAIYLKNINAFYQDEQLIRKLAGVLRKRILVRSDPGVLMPSEQAKKQIQELLPAEAGVQSIEFSPEFCEVVIEAMKPGLVIGKGGATLKGIIMKTGWAPKILRTPTMPSETIAGIRKSLLKGAEQRKKFLQGVGKKISSPFTKSDWVKVTALGGFREVGRTCILVQTPNDKILIDCGVNPETTDGPKAFPYLNAMNLALDELDAVIITHAHLDHSGFVPYLYAYGFKGPTYCTAPTRDLMTMLHFDYIDVVQKQGGNSPYHEKDVRTTMNHVITREYEEVTDITPEIKLTFHNSGHILGSAMVHLHISEGLHNLVYTGDIKYAYTQLFEPANTRFPRVETMFMESTYGGRDDVSPPRHEMEARLCSTIQQTLDAGGKVVIPVFAVGRSQEIMLVLEEYVQKHPEFKYPVYIDGMVLEASAIHTAYPEYLRQNVQRRILSNNSPFENKVFEVVKKNRKEIVEGGPCVILAPSGMLSGGPSLEYFKALSDDAKNTLIFVGYQSVLSMGRKLQKGAREVPILGEDGRIQTQKINMRIETVEGFSGHSDRHQLMSFVRNIRPQPERIFTCHGDETKCEDLARGLARLTRSESRAPMNLDSIRLK